MGRLQLSFLYALSAVGFTAPESGRPKEARHIRAYMTKYVRIPANTYIFVLRKKPRYLSLAIHTDTY